VGWYPYRNGTADVGHRYSVRLAVLDAAGNQSEERRAALSVPAPSPGPKYEVSTSLSLPVIVNYVRTKVEPKFPEAGRRAHIHGVVSGVLHLNRAGEVVDVVVEKDLPMGFAAATVQALKQWKFAGIGLDGARIGFSTHFMFVPAAYQPVWAFESLGAPTEP
jgi:hypothetical protein